MPWGVGKDREEEGIWSQRGEAMEAEWLRWPTPIAPSLSLDRDGWGQLQTWKGFGGAYGV